VAIKDENQTLATITLQNYFRLYDKLAGMTGTAVTEANEFHSIYKLGVVPIPTNKPMIRDDQADVVYQTAQNKFEACVEDIVERHQAGQPVLVGTTSVEKSEILSKMLKRRGVPHEVLNAKYHEREATIVAQAGRRGAVTVATNMAGRGTDIMLGGNPEFIADAELHQRGLSPVETPEDYEAAWPEAVAKAKRAVAEEHEEVVEAGGLYVLGTERHESRRIDNQLRGRSGRQGDPGESRFYLSLEDDLMRMFNSERVGAIMERLNIPPDTPVESKVVTRAIRSAQTQVEQQNFEIRKDVLKYDDVMNRQRQVIYGERHKVLEGADLHEQIAEMVDEVVAGYVAGETSDGYPEEWDLDKLWRAFGQLYPVGLTVEDVIEDAGGDRAGLTGEFITETMIADAQAAYQRREEEFGSEVMREVERRVVLSVLDRKWREHLYEMDYLREGIGLRGYGQRDPLIEYQREGYDMFGAMMEGIKEESVGLLFNLEVQVQENPIVEEAEAPGAMPPGAVPAQDAVPAQGGRPAQGAVPAQGRPAGAPARGAMPAEADGGQRAQGGTATPKRDGRVSGGQGQSGRRDGRSGGARARRTGPSAGGQNTSAGQGASAGQDGPVPAGFGPRRPQRLQYQAPSIDGGAHVETSTGPGVRGDFAHVGRNDPCPCGSGRKYKRCHGDPRTRQDA
jgi:preprotein translocase subunit SecA